MCNPQRRFLPPAHSLQGEKFSSSSVVPSAGCSFALPGCLCPPCSTCAWRRCCRASGALPHQAAAMSGANAALGAECAFPMQPGVRGWRWQGPDCPGQQRRSARWHADHQLPPALQRMCMGGMQQQCERISKGLAMVACSRASGAAVQRSSGATSEQSIKLAATTPTAAAAIGQQGQRLDLPVLPGSSGPAPPLLHADDMVLLATSAAGLRQQFDVPQQYCQRWEPTVSLVKTKWVLLSGARIKQATSQTARATGLRFTGQPPALVVSFSTPALSSTPAPAWQAVLARREHCWPTKPCTAAGCRVHSSAYRRRQCSRSCSAPEWTLRCPTGRGVGHAAGGTGSSQRWQHRVEQGGAGAHLIPAAPAGGAADYTVSSGAGGGRRAATLAALAAAGSQTMEQHAAGAARQFAAPGAGGQPAAGSNSGGASGGAAALGSAVCSSHGTCRPACEPNGSRKR